MADRARSPRGLAKPLSGSLGGRQYIIYHSGTRQVLKLLTGAAVNPSSSQFPKQVINWKAIYNNC